MDMSESSGRRIVIRSFACLVAITLIGLPLIYRSSASTHSAKTRPNAIAASAGKIAFASDRDGNLEIYLMDTDGGVQTRLTENPGEDYSPAWSPDGKRLAFVSTRDGNAEIYVMNADGTNQTRLTNNTASDLHPAWAPNGTQIAF